MSTVRTSKSRQRVRRGKNGEAIAESIRFGTLERWVGFNLRMAQEHAFEAFSRRSQEIGESPGRFATLTLIARNPGISQTELSHANGRDKSSLTPVVEDLVRRGLVERKRMREDRRTYRLNLTPAGKRTLTMLTRCARRHERVLDSIIGAARPHAVSADPEADRGGDRVAAGVTADRTSLAPRPEPDAICSGRDRPDRAPPTRASPSTRHRSGRCW